MDWEGTVVLPGGLSSAPTGWREPAAVPRQSHARSGEVRSRRSLGGVGGARRHRLHTRRVQFFGRWRGLRQRSRRRQREQGAAVDAHAAQAMRAHQPWTVGVFRVRQALIGRAGRAGRVAMTVGGRVIRRRWMVRLSRCRCRCRPRCAWLHVRVMR
jgi:hypothetical protein